MEKTKIVESILEAVKLEVADFVECESDIQCPVEYELKVIELSRVFARSLISKSRGKLPQSRNEKKSSDHIWQVGFE